VSFGTLGNDTSLGGPAEQSLQCLSLEVKSVAEPSEGVDTRYFENEIHMHGNGFNCFSDTKRNDVELNEAHSQFAVQS
jgi:hypothetical protein